MGLFDAFTTKNADAAAAAQKQASQWAMDAYNANAQSGRNVLTSNVNTGLGALSDAYSQGRNALNTNYGAALQPWQTNFGVNNQGQQLFADALGVNGPEGQARARDTFQAGPGYQWMLNQGNENILRNNARTGSPASGQTNIDLLTYGQGLANQQWQNWLQTLQPYTQAANTSAAGLGGTYGNLANALAGNFQGLGTQQNATYSDLGSKLLGSFTGQGSADASLFGNMGNAQANADLAGNTASANLWGALLNGGKMLAGGGIGNGLSGIGTGAANMAGGLSNAGTALFGMFSDERIKEGVERVGALFDGQPIYRYRYTGDPRTQIGLLAQEVEDVEPEAVFDADIPGLRGLKMVDYHKATNRAAELMRLAA